MNLRDFRSARALLEQLTVNLKTHLKKAAQTIGLEIRLTSLRSRDDLRLVHFLKMHDIGLVLDVGANMGQFGRQLFGAGYSGRIVSFEPLPEAHAALTQAARAFGERWMVAPRLALSDRSGMAEFHVTETSTASSFFRPKESLVAATPQTRVAAKIEVSTARLDDVLVDLGIMRHGLFLKLDVQGAESLVLAGAGLALANAKGMLTELSLTPLYDHEPPVRDVLEVIHSAGFEVWDVWPGYRNPQSHRLNQIDVVCFKPGATDLLCRPSCTD